MEPLTLQAGRRNRPVAGGLLVLTSALMFAGVGALVKAASVDLPTEVVVFFRNGAVLTCSAGIIATYHSERHIKP